ncbi:MAG: hypothetical protein LBF42_00750, partial [Puniceicoccales bacterium]|nr:hypothetical protein [Puniceicoccales bacterium]
MEASHVEHVAHPGQGVNDSHTQSPIIPGPQGLTNVSKDRTSDLASALATRTSAAGPEIPRDKTPTALPSPATSDPNPQPSQ